MMDNAIVNIYDLVFSWDEEDIIRVQQPRLFKERTRYYCENFQQIKEVLSSFSLKKRANY